jgi:excisionase family DNA binding protein
MDSPYLTLAEAAAYARCSKRTVQRWLSDKKLCRHGHGRHVLILKAELEALLSTSQGT